MDAKEFAKEFVNDFLEDLPKTNLDTDGYHFDKNVLRDDPELKVLNNELKKVGYTIFLVDEDGRYKIKKI